MGLQRIEAPPRVLATVRQTEEAIRRMQAEANAVLFGAAAALEVPDGWRWDGAGWSAPSVVSKDGSSTETDTSRRPQ